MIILLIIKSFSKKPLITNDIGIVSKMFLFYTFKIYKYMYL